MNPSGDRKKWQFDSVGSAGVRFGVRLASVSILCMIGAVVFWNQLGNLWIWLSHGESGSATLGNIGLLVVAAIGTPFAIWRSVVAGRQAETAQRGLRNERYQKAVEMLGDSILVVRLGGIYALHHLAKEDPTQYHIQVMRLFSAFVRHPTAPSSTDVTQNGIVEISGKHERGARVSIRRDVEDVLRAIGTRTKEEIEIESRAGYELVIYEANLRELGIRDVISFEYDLTIEPEFKLSERTKQRRENLSNIHLRRVDMSKADLSFVNMSNTEFRDPNIAGARFENADLSRTSWEGGTLEGTVLSHADLSNARMLETNLSNADLAGADLSGVIFEEVDLSGASLRDANLSGTCFSLGNYRGALFSRKGIEQFVPEVEGFYVGVRNLTQAQIDQARADPKNPPQLEGVVDGNTGKPLVWQGESSST